MLHHISLTQSIILGLALGFEEKIIPVTHFNYAINFGKQLLIFSIWHQKVVSCSVASERMPQRLKMKNFREIKGTVKDIFWLYVSNVKAKIILSKHLSPGNQEQLSSGIYHITCLRKSSSLVVFLVISNILIQKQEGLLGKKKKKKRLNLTHLSFSKTYIEY